MSEEAKLLKGEPKIADLKNSVIADLLKPPFITDQNIKFVLESTKSPTLLDYIIDAPLSIIIEMYALSNQENITRALNNLIAMRELDMGEGIYPSMALYVINALKNWEQKDYWSEKVTPSARSNAFKKVIKDDVLTAGELSAMLPKSNFERIKAVNTYLLPLYLRALSADTVRKYQGGEILNELINNPTPPKKAKIIEALPKEVQKEENWKRIDLSKVPRGKAPYIENPDIAVGKAYYSANTEAIRALNAGMSDNDIATALNSPNAYQYMLNGIPFDGLPSLNIGESFAGMHNCAGGVPVSYNKQISIRIPKVFINKRLTVRPPLVGSLMSKLINFAWKLTGIGGLPSGIFSFLMRRFLLASAGLGTDTILDTTFMNTLLNTLHTKYAGFIGLYEDYSKNRADAVAIVKSAKAAYKLTKIARKAFLKKMETNGPGVAKMISRILASSPTNLPKTIGTPFDLAPIEEYNTKKGTLSNLKRDYPEKDYIEQYI